MAILEEQEALGNLLQQVNDAHSELYKALFKFQTTANYFPNVPESTFMEVEEALKAVEQSLGHVRMTIGIFIKEAGEIEEGGFAQASTVTLT